MNSENFLQEQVATRDIAIKNLLSIIKKELRLQEIIKKYRCRKIADIFDFCREIDEEVSDNLVCECLRK